MAENQQPEDRELDIYDTWFDEEEESADDENLDDEDSSPESDEEVEVPEEEDHDEAPETVAAHGTETEAKAKEEDPYSWVSELDPEFKQKVEALVHRDRSNAGRAAALQARLDEAQARLEAQRRVPATSAPPKAAPTSEEIADMDDDELKEFMEEFPSVAASVEKMIARREARTREEILAEIRPIQQEAEAARVYERKQELRHIASDIFNTAETGIDLDTVLQSERWKEWVGQQSPGYRKYISQANEVEDAAKVLADFAQYANYQVYSMYQAQQEQMQREDASHADETAARRKSAQKGTTPRSRTAELSDRGRSASYESYFDEFAS